MYTDLAIAILALLCIAVFPLVCWFDRRHYQGFPVMQKKATPLISVLQGLWIPVLVVIGLGFLLFGLIFLAFA